MRLPSLRVLFLVDESLMEHRRCGSSLPSPIIYRTGNQARILTSDLEGDYQTVRIHDVLEDRQCNIIYKVEP